VDVVTMTFTLIDPKEPTRPFAFDLVLREDNTYAGTGCWPRLCVRPSHPGRCSVAGAALAVENMLPEVDGVFALLESLNRSSNLAEFMWQMRTLFQQAALRAH
jgi:hypothetical protein